MKIVLFLGAGFSAPFGLPVMDKFTRVAHDSGRLSKEDLEFLDELIREARSANAFLLSSPTNLEDILSLAVMQDRLEVQGAGFPRTPRIIQILQKIYTTPGNPDDFWGRLGVLEDFLGDALIKPQNSLSVITTNYDLMVESAFYRIQTPLSLVQEFRPYPDDTNVQVHGKLYSESGPSLYKLHGSVNWFLVNDSLCVESRVVGVQSQKWDAKLPRVCTKNYKPADIPLIVPPSFLKPDLKGPLTRIWSGAAKSLLEADQLVFIGYSFPSSDTEMKYFLASSLVDNAQIRRIDVFDLHAQQLCEKLSASNSGFGNHFTGLLKPISGDWTQAKLELA